MNPGYHETYKGACLFSLSSQGALLVQYTPYGQALFVELHEPSYYCITSLILLNFYKPKNCPAPFLLQKRKAQGSFLEVFSRILWNQGQKNPALLKFSLFFFTKYTIIRCNIGLPLFLLLPASL